MPPADWSAEAGWGRTPGWQVMTAAAQMNTLEEAPQSAWRLSSRFYLRRFKEISSPSCLGPVFKLSCLTVSHLRQSQPRWRCRQRPAQDSSQSSTPSRSWCWSRSGPTHGALKGAQGPSRHRLEPSESLCQSPDSASCTSGSYPQSTAGLQREQKEM